MRQGGGVDVLITEEPYDRIGHVRICAEWAHDTHLPMLLKIKGFLIRVTGQRATGDGGSNCMLH
jgi:hypothetical protein